MKIHDMYILAFAMLYYVKQHIKKFPHNGYLMLCTWIINYYKACQQKA